MSDKNTPQEIDLLELFQRLGNSISNLFKKTFNLIFFLIAFGIRKAHFLVLFGIAGGLIGLLVYSQTNRYYSSDMVAQPNGISARDMVSYINDLHTLTKRHNTEALSYSLNMEDSITQKVKNIEAFHYIDVNRDGVGDYVDFKNTYDPKDTNQVIVNRRILIRVEVLDNSSFRDVKQGIFSYIKSNPYLIKLNEIRRKELIELISSTENEIQKLDSLQNYDYFTSQTERISSSNESRLMFLAEKDKRLYYHDKQSLTKQKQAYEKELALATDAITVIKDFTELTVEENPRGGYIVKIGLSHIIIGFIVLLIIWAKKNKKISAFTSP